MIANPLSIRKLISFGAAAAMLPLAAPATAQEACRSALSPADIRGAAADMSLPSEAVPLDSHGRPHPLDWVQRGRAKWGSDPHGFRAITPWAAIFEAPDNRVAAAKVEVRNLELMVLSRRTGQWRRLFDTGKFSGRYYDRDVVGNREEGVIPMVPAGGGSALPADGRYMTHFWPASGRTAIDPADIAGVFVTAEGRIDQRDYANGARFLMDVAADYWRDMRAQPAGMTNTNDAAIGRLKMLTPEWRRFYMTTASPAAMAACIAP